MILHFSLLLLLFSSSNLLFVESTFFGYSFFKSFFPRPCSASAQALSRRRKIRRSRHLNKRRFKPRRLCSPIAHPRQQIKPQAVSRWGVGSTERFLTSPEYTGIYRGGALADCTAGDCTHIKIRIILSVDSQTRP